MYQPHPFRSDTAILPAVYRADCLFQGRSAPFKHLLWASWFALAAAAALPACAPTPPPATATPTATPTLTPTVVPTPTLAAEFSELRIQDAAPSGRSVIGLVHNISPYPVSDLSLQIAMFDQQGGLIDAALSKPLYDQLGPGEVSPFRVPFPDGPEPAQILIEAVEYSPLNAAPARLLLEVTDRTQSGSGEIILQGRARYDRPYTLSRVVALVASPDTVPLEWIESNDFMFWGSPEAPAVFTLVIPQQHASAELMLFPVWGESGREPPSALTFSRTPELATDDQGDPFVLGEVRNAGETAAGGQILLRFLLGGVQVAFHTLRLPSPIPPGSTLVFAVDDLPIIDTLAAAGDLDTQALAIEASLAADPADASRRAVRLPAEILEFEVIGSTAYLTVRVENDESSPVQSPTTIAALRTTGGELLAAAWGALNGAIQPGQRQTVLVEVPLPPGVDVFRGEFDIWATGWLPKTE